MAIPTTKPQTYLDDALGTGLKICPPPVVTNTIAYIGPDGETYANYCYDTDARPDTIIVNLVYDSGEEGPVTERPVFDLAADFSLTDLSTKQHMMEKIVHGVLGVPQDRWYERRNRWLYWNKIKIYGGFIVVDWNFKHLTDTPYVPTPYTPEWLSTNSP